MARLVWNGSARNGLRATKLPGIAGRQNVRLGLKTAEGGWNRRVYEILRPANFPSIAPKNAA